VAYTTRTKVKARLGIPDSVTSEDDAIDDAIAAADAEVDEWCGRTFDVPASATARVWRPDTNVLVLVDDIAQTTGLIVKTDTSNDGSFSTTLTVTDDYILEGNAAPYRRLRRVDGAAWPRYQSHRPTVEVTAFWGYAMTVPAGVAEAAKILAARLYQRRSSPLGFVAGFEGESIRISWQDPDVRALLRGFRRIGLA